MKKETYIFDPRPQYPCVFTVARYPGQSADDGASLIFAHGIGFHKEQWEPVVEHLYENERKKGGFKIREAWSIECPNHGDSAILNEETLLTGCYDKVFGWEEYARVIHAFLTGLGKLRLQERGTECEVEVDFTKRKLICVGHSMGSAALILTQMFHPPICFSSCVLIEPVLISIPLERKFGLADLAAGAVRREDLWPSRARAWEILNSTRIWRTWDRRVLKLYVEHGLRDTPSSDPTGRTGVTLKCTKVQEIACYRDFTGRQRAYDLIGHLCSKSPVHVIWGGISSIHPQIKADIQGVAARGMITSVQEIARVGHLIPQISPRLAADAVWATFVNIPRKCKL